MTDIKPFKIGDVVEYFDRDGGRWQRAKIYSVYPHASRYGEVARTKLGLDRVLLDGRSLGLRGVNVYASNVRHVS